MKNVNRRPGDGFFLLSLILISAASCFSAAGIQAPPKNQRVTFDGPTFYKLVLDRVFPREKFDMQKEGRLIIFRILPSFGAESQVTILEKANGQSEIVYRRIDDKYGNIGVHINRLWEKNINPDIDDVDAVAHELHVIAKIINSPSPELTSAIRELPDTPPPWNLGSVVVIDSTSYELWVESSVGNLHMEADDRGPSSGAIKNPTANWMVRVMKLVQAAPGIESTETSATGARAPMFQAQSAALP